MSERSRSPSRCRDDEEIDKERPRSCRSSPERDDTPERGRDDDKARREDVRRRDDSPGGRYRRDKRSPSRSPRRTARRSGSRDHSDREGARNGRDGRGEDASYSRRDRQGRGDAPRGDRPRDARHIDWDRDAPRASSPRPARRGDDRMADWERRFGSSRGEASRDGDDRRHRDRDGDRRPDRGAARDAMAVNERYRRPDRDDGGRQGGRDRRDEGRGRRPEGDSNERARTRGRGTEAGDDPGGAVAAAPRSGDAGAGPSGGGGAAAPWQRKAPETGRSGGVYIPPFRLKQMLAEASQDKSTEQYQRMMWEALRKTLNGIVNKVNASNLKQIAAELLRENLQRGRGVLCQALLKAQAASPTFTPVFAALVAIVNQCVPYVTELLLARLVTLYQRAFRRSDKAVCKAAITFLAHLTNQRVLGNFTVTQVLQLLLDQPTEDSVELAVELTMATGACLEEDSPDVLHAIFHELRRILQEGRVPKRTQYQIETLMATRKAGFEASGHPALKAELDLVEEDDKITHEQVDITAKYDPQKALNVFKFDPDFEKHEAEWKALSDGWLGAGDGDSDGDGSGESGSDDDEDSDEDDDDDAGAKPDQPTQVIQDMTSTDLVNLRRTLYLTIMSSATFEEAGHKLLKLRLPPQQEGEVCAIILECCGQEKTYMNFYGLLAQRFCARMISYAHSFEDCFVRNLQLCHRLETNKLRNIAKLFAHLLGHRAISWEVLREVRITEADTTSATRIFYKYLFKDLAENLSLSRLNEILRDPDVAPHLGGVFPQDSMANMRFSINFFTAIGLGGITVDLRAKLASAETEMREVEMQRALAQVQGDGDDSSSTSSGSRSSSGSSGESSSGSGSSSSSSGSSGGPRRRGGRGGEGKRRRGEESDADSGPPRRRQREGSREAGGRAGSRERQKSRERPQEWEQRRSRDRHQSRERVRA
eukprot:jgi/Ulvmu1/8777/UM048_0032.1